jgi:4-amino-4-deoxy-L-arabinose transferase-like glycosyltransferase
MNASVYGSRLTGAAALIWVCLWAVLAAYLPAFPVDETRYLTVAWEMHRSGDYLLPTLNGAPYSHKPPMLFWLINLVWALTGGPSVGAARIIPLAASLFTFFLTIILARRMFPARERVSGLSGLLLMAFPAFMVYGIMIMFDFMQAACVALAMIAAWDAYAQKRFKSWLLFGFATGLGVLAKGPVILVHVLPVVLLFPFFMRRQWNGPQLKHWYGGIAVAFLVALFMGLAWAVPAAIHGGPKFTHMIFWEQSAGRVSNAFAHRRPFWFYAPVMSLFLLPMLFWAPFWASTKRIFESRRDPAIVFLLCWMIPVFLIFSLISSKQPHYLIPMLPGVAILLARFIDEQNKTRWLNLTYLIPAVLGFLVLAFASYIQPEHAGETSYLLTGLQQFHTPIILGRLAVALIFAAALGATIEGQIMSIILATAILLGTATAESNRGLLSYYDLTPVAAQLEKYKDRPIAFAPEYAGEVGFLAHLEKPVDVIEFPEIKKWLTAHHNGTIVIRYREKADIKAYKALYTMEYRGTGFVSLIQAK